MDIVLYCLAIVIAAVITGLLGYFMVPFLHKIKFGQTIRELGPSWHKNKQGTPTMGGIMFIIGSSVGAMIGFLFWNANPAKVFMGDTGSLFLGGAVCALAFGVDMPILLILIGIIYIVEILSVVLQVTYFKISHGKRIFKMAPIHHHFEMCGWNEKRRHPKPQGAANGAGASNIEFSLWVSALT